MNHSHLTALLASAFFASALSSPAQQPIAVGKGSYASAPPAGLMMDKKRNADVVDEVEKRQLFLVKDDGRPIPRNGKALLIFVFSANASARRPAAFPQISAPCVSSSLSCSSSPLHSLPLRTSRTSSSSSPTTSMDLLPTIAKFAGTEAPENREMDGVDIAPLLLDRDGAGLIQTETSQRVPKTEPKSGTTSIVRADREVFCYYRGTELFAARLGPWKMHFITQPAYGTPKPEPDDPPRLFNLEADPGESFECGADHPDVIAQIKAAVEKHKATVKPVKNQLVETFAK